MPEPRAHGRDLTTGSVPRHLLDLALPMLAGNLLNTGYSIINTIWLGRIAGEYAVGAAAVSFPVVFVFVALVAGSTMATTILVSQYYGARRRGEVERVVGCSFALGLALGTVLALAGVVASRAVLRLLQTPPEILDMATVYLRITYLRIVGPASMLFAALFVSNGVINGSGRTMVTMGISFIALWGLRVPLAVILSRTSLGLTGVWIAFVAGFAVGLTASLIYYRTGRWRVAVTRTPPPEETVVADNR